MLVLLIIFIITAPLLTHAVKIDLTKASSTLLTEKPEVISLSIDATRQMYWNDALVSPDALTQKITDASKNNQSQSFTLGLIKKRAIRY
jgi:biopolymer transport protein ExbD